jgi:hypothetical protein
MNGLDRIKNEIGNTFQVEISSHAEVHVDSYEHGEGEWRNSWENQTMSFTVIDENELADTIKTKLKDYIENELYTDYNQDDLVEMFNNYGDETYFYITKFVDVDNQEPSDSQIEDWKKGQEELFIQDNTVTVSINGTDITGESLQALLFAETMEA